MEQSTRVRLGASRGTIAVNLIVGGVCALIGIAGLAAIAVLLTMPDFTGGQRLVIIAMFGAISAITLRQPWVWFREICFRGAALTVSDGLLRIDDPRLLDRPLVLPLAEVMVATVDEPVPGAADRKFPVYRSFSWQSVGAPAEMEPVGFLVGPEDVCLLPLTAGATELNCALVFRSPRRCSAHRRHGFLARRADIDLQVGGLILSAARLNDFIETFAAAGLLRRLTTSDLNAAPETVPFEQASAAQPGPAVPASAPPSAPPSATAPVHMQTVSTPSDHPDRQSDHSAILTEPPPECVPDAASIERRTLALIRGFYMRVVLAFAALIAAGVVSFMVFGRMTWLGLACVGSAAILARVAWPRDEHWCDDRPELDLAANPEVARLVANICAASGVAPPRSIRLNLEFGASTQPHELNFEKGGYTIALGMPMLATSNVSQLASVIAHEVAHARDDLARVRQLGRACDAVGRTYDRFCEYALFGDLVEESADRFARRLSALARESEYRADLHAATTVGADSTTEMLRKLPVADRATEIYWATFAAPMLEAGLAPPLAVGLAHYVREAQWVRETMDDIDDLLEGEVASVYHDHPRVIDRIKFVTRFATVGGHRVDRRSALSLLADPARLERDLLEHLAGNRVTALRPCDWPVALRTGLPPHWRMLRDQYEPALAQYAWWQLHDLMIDKQSFAAAVGIPIHDSRQVHAQGDPFAPEFPMSFHLAVLNIASFSTALIERNFELLATVPGAPIEFKHGATSLDAAETIRQLTLGEMTRKQWIEGCRRLGIAEAPMASPERSESSAADVSAAYA
ncbi:MAG: M48 family metallopeptidase [Actinobacteria bacterium]|nr:M48 family metallopeptidase [Actinomycetota bacterium]